MHPVRRYDTPNVEDARQALLLAIEKNFLHTHCGPQLRELHRHLSYVSADKEFMLIMLRHLDSNHPFLSKSFVSRSKQERKADVDAEEKQGIMKKYQEYLGEMP